MNDMWIGSEVQRGDISANGLRIVLFLEDGRNPSGRFVGDQKGCNLGRKWSPGKGMICSRNFAEGWALRKTAPVSTVVEIVLRLEVLKGGI
jgi:hypothetical protein